MSEDLSFTFHDDGSVAVLCVHGRIDSSTSGKFEKELGPVLEAPSRPLLIDLAGLSYMSSAGLRVLLMAAKRCKAGGHRLMLCSLGSNIREVFDVSGFSAIFEIAEKRAEAKARLTR